MTPCIDWRLKKRTPDGYGIVTIEKKKYLAHRAAYCVAHGLPFDAIRGKVVRHACNNPGCVNPDHLMLGTQADNIRDKMEHGRIDQQRGERHYRARLSEEDVRAIRARYQAGGITQTALGKEYGVTQSVIARILSRKAWSHLP